MPSYEKLALKSQFDLIRFYDVIFRFLTRFFNSGFPDPEKFHL